MNEIILHAGDLSLHDLRRIWGGGVRLILTPETYDKIERSRQTVCDIVESGQTVYGVNTGFGRLASKRIGREQLETLQENLILSHSTGTGPDIDAGTVRLILALKVNSLAQGYSGVRKVLVEALLALLNCDVLPAIPAKGSVGASGDLVPLAHMSAILLGHGEAYVGGRKVPAAEALQHAGIEPVRLGPKEGLALINGTQVSCAFAISALLRIENAYAAALKAGCLSLEAAKGSPAPFRAEIHAVRRQQGQIDCAAALRDLLEGSPLRESHLDCDKVQDPYCLRCMPQVLGACLDQIRHAGDVLGREANAVSDNPLVFPETGEILSGGNFHAEPVAIVADGLAVAIAETGSISERRVAMLIDSNHSGLPPFLVKDPGVDSGFMIAHVTAAALTSENKMLSHPASVDSIPTSANQEDHVSMATHGARRLLEMADNLCAIVAIELLASAQGIEFHRPLRTSDKLEETHALIRTRAKWLEKDRFFAPDIAGVKALVANGAFNDHVGVLLPSMKQR